MKTVLISSRLRVEIYPPLEGEGRSRSERGGVAMVKPTISNFRRTAANRLRSRTTQAENVLWRNLRRLEITGSHFRRQVVIGPYIADFACMSTRLIVEVDGSQHAAPEHVRRDEARTRWLQNEGYRMLRFWNNDVMARTDSVLDAIFAALSLTPPRLPSAGDPPPQGEGEALRGETT